MKVTSAKSNKRYNEVGGMINLPYYDIFVDNIKVGKMKADYTTMTQKSYSGKAIIAGQRIVVSGKKSMKQVLDSMQEMCNNLNTVEVQANIVETESEEV